jgi:hypothetical protein
MLFLNPVQLLLSIYSPIGSLDILFHYKITPLPNGGELREYSNGDKYWCLKGNSLHREDGPAIEYVGGRKDWYLNNKIHREDGPAIEFANGDKEWWLNGKYHREDGPAVEWSNGGKVWYINDKYMPCTTQIEFERLLKLKVFW